MGNWSNGVWWVLDANRTRLYGPVGSMEQCKTWLREHVGSKLRLKSTGTGVHEYSSGHFIVEEHGYNEFLATQKPTCPECFLLHAGECI